MDKKVHKIMNIEENLFVLVGISCMLFAIKLHNGNHFDGIDTYYMILQSFGMFSAFVVVSIELLLFHLQIIKVKLLSIVYYILELLLTLWINTMIPFSGLIVLTTLSIVKNVSRMFMVEKIYKPLGYYELCKKFGIKVKKPVVRKKKVTSKKSVSVVKNAKSKSKSSVKTKNRKSVDAKTRKSYA